MQEASEAKSSEIAALTSSNESVKAALKEQKQEVGRLRRQLVEQTSAYESMVAQQQQAPEQQAKGTDETKVTGVGDKVLHGDEEQLPPMLAVEDEEENDVVSSPGWLVPIVPVCIHSPHCFRLRWPVHLSLALTVV